MVPVPVRGLPYMTSALRGEGVPDIVSNLSKGGCVNLQTGQGGFKKSKKFADVIYGSPLSTLQGDTSNLG